MHLSQVLVVCALLASCSTVASYSSPFKTLSSDSLEATQRSHQDAVGGTRSRRVSKSTDDEERFIPALRKWFRTTYWLETGKSDDYVQKVLGLDELSGAALKSAPNYVYYEHFLYTREGHILEKWLSKGVSTKSVWATYKLGDIPAAQLKDNEGFQTYLRYATMQDNQIFKLKNKDLDVVVDYSGTPAEMNAKVDMWISLNRPHWYVKKMLNLDNRSRNELKRSANYPLYENFVYGMEGRMLENWLAKGISMEHVWKVCKLDDIPQAKLKNNAAYKTYVRYATMVDDQVFPLRNSGKEIKLQNGGTSSEMNAKVEIWASANRPNKYVEEMLSLEGAALKTSPNYKYYEKFLRLKEQLNKD